MWQSTATWEQFWEWSDEFDPSQRVNEGRIAQAWVNVRGGLRVFSLYFWYSEGWTPRNEALLEGVLRQARTTRHPWLIACDANMCPEDFKWSLWFQQEQMRVVAPKEASTCRSKGPKGEWIKRTFDDVIASGSPKGKISKMEEDFESTPHKAVSVVEKTKEIQEWSVQKLPKVLPSYGGGKLPRKSAKEKGREEEAEDENCTEKKVRFEIAQEVVASTKEKAGVHEDAKSTT